MSQENQPQPSDGLSDFLHDHGIECYVLSPTHLPKKTDAKDAQMLLEQVRGHVLLS
jgi:transposase